MIRVIFTRFFLALILTFSLSISGEAAPKKDKKARVVYEKDTHLDFEGLNLRGELKNPAEFYFQNRAEEKFNSLVKRRENFHREMQRDVVLSK